MKLAASDVVSCVKEQVSADLPDEAIILNTKTWMYFGVDGVGARVWELLQKPISVRDLQEAVLAEYDVERRRCEADLTSLLEAMLDNHLIEVRREGKR